MRSRLLKYAGASDLNLRANTKHNFAANFALKAYLSNAIYSFIPKNACSTMRLSLAVANQCIEDDASQFNWIHKNNETFRATLEDLVCADYTFVILRDPLARLASCYLDKIVGKDVVAWHFHDLLERAQDLDVVSFSDFVRGLARKATITGNMHWRPQVDFLVYKTYDDYLPFEDMAATAGAIEERAKMRVIDARGRTQHGTDSYKLLPATEDFSCVPAARIAELQRNGECPHPRSLFSPDLIETAQRLYAADIDLYREKIGQSSFLAD